MDVAVKLSAASHRAAELLARLPTSQLPITLTLNPASVLFIEQAQIRRRCCHLA